MRFVASSNRFGWLLALLLASLVLQSLGTEPGIEGVLDQVLETALATAIFFGVFLHRRTRWVGGILFALLVGTAWLRDVVAGTAAAGGLALVNHGVGAVFMWSAVWTILADLLHSRVVSGEGVRGAICGYLIAGAGWTNLNLIAWLLVPASFSIDPHVVALFGDWHSRAAVVSMYSFSQMLTIGYNDVTPVRAPATTLSLFAALFGVFYMAIVVSQFVGLAQANRNSPPSAP